MRQRGRAVTAPSFPPSCRRIASITSKRPSNGWRVGIRPIPMPSNGSTFRGRNASRTRCAVPWRADMGRYVFKLPDVGEGTAEAEIVAWHVAIGDHVNEDQNLVDVMTDKATVEMTSPVSGVVVSLNGSPGEMAAVGAPLVELDVEGAGNVKANGAEKKAAAVAKAAPAKIEAPVPKPAAKAEAPKAAPAAVE